MTARSTIRLAPATAALAICQLKGPEFEAASIKVSRAEPGSASGITTYERRRGARNVTFWS